MHGVCVLCMFVLTLALSCVVRAETFSWEASSSLRSLRICRRNIAWHQKQRQEKAHAPSQIYQTHSCAHILTNNVAANMGVLIHLGNATDKKRCTQVFREEWKPVTRSHSQELLWKSPYVPTSWHPENERAKKTLRGGLELTSDCDFSSFCKSKHTREKKPLETFLTGCNHKE